MDLSPLHALNPARFETARLFRQLNQASRQLAELKGVAASIPNQGMLINTLTLQEAKDSSAIESIVTTHDELYRHEQQETVPPAAKEVLRYRQALRVGYSAIREHGLITNRTIMQIQANLELAQTGLRKIPGTSLKNHHGEVIYTPPTPEKLPDLLADLEKFINDDKLFPCDPLIKMALIHYQFESIHPFYDGNGRTGRIINVLYLVKQGLLEIPVLYLSRHIVRTKPEYYRLLQAVRQNDDWESWILYMLESIEIIAGESIGLIKNIRRLSGQMKAAIRKNHSFYSQDLINLLFMHPYTTIERFMADMNISKSSAIRYLKALVESGILEKKQLGRRVYYINHQLVALLTDERMQ